LAGERPGPESSKDLPDGRPERTRTGPSVRLHPAGSQPTRHPVITYPPISPRTALKKPVPLGGGETDPAG